MNRYIKNLKDFLAEQPCQFGYDTESILEVLCYYYIENNPLENAVIRCQFSELDHILSKLSFSDNNAIFCLTADLCTSHARKAFVDGIKVGLHLMAELDDSSS